MTQILRAIDWMFWPLAVLGVFVLGLVLLVLVFRPTYKKVVYRIIWAVSLVVFLSAALSPSPLSDPARPINLVPFASGAGTTTEIALNLLAFVWVGSLARLSQHQALVLVTLATPFTVELLQFVLGWGRVASTTDLIVGTAGAIAGAFVTARVVAGRGRRATQVGTTTAGRLEA